MSSIAHGSIMAASQSPNTISEPSNQSPTHSAATSRKRKHSSIHNGSTSREYGLMRGTGEQDYARFVGSSSGIHFIRNVHVRLARRSACRPKDGVPGNGNTGIGQLGELVPGEDDQLKRGGTQRDSKDGHLWRQAEISLGDEETPSFDNLVEWTRSYFEEWHPILPFLNGPDVLRIFEEASSNGIASLHHLDRSILRSVLSISLADSRQAVALRQAIPAPFLFQTVDEAVSSSQFALCQPASIRATQAVLSIQLFLVSMLCLNAASRLGGLIARMAFHLGLHRCPTRYPFFSPQEAQRRRRVFWCIYCLERFLSQSLGLPLDIRDDDIDVCYPGEELHGAGLADSAGDSRMNLLTYMAKHAKIRGLILELRNKSIHTRQDTAERVVSVQTELAKWSNEIQDVVEDTDDADDSEPKISGSHRLVLLLSKYESTISLNRPIMASGPSTPLWSSAMQACISAAKSICIAMKRHSSQSKASMSQTETTLVRPMLWPSFIWATWISAFVLAYAAFEQQMSLESALRHIESSKEALRHIAARGTSWPEYCLSAIDELTSAVRELSHVDEANSDSLGLRDVQGVADGPRSSDVAVGNPAALVSAGRGNQQERAGDAGLPSTASNPDGLGQRYPNPADYERALRRRVQPWAQGPAIPPQGDQRSGPAYEPPQDAWSSDVAGPGLTGEQFPTSAQLDGTDVALNTMPGEGQESMVWYDQLFDSSFSAIDNPFLAVAQFDSSIDPTWSYLR